MRSPAPAWSADRNGFPVWLPLGEVATDPKQRRSGISTRLCACALEEFRGNGGEAIFLGTGNPDAARVYYRWAGAAWQAPT